MSGGYWSQSDFDVSNGVSDGERSALPDCRPQNGRRLESRNSSLARGGFNEDPPAGRILPQPIAGAQLRSIVDRDNVGACFRAPFEIQNHDDAHRGGEEAPVGNKSLPTGACRSLQERPPLVASTASKGARGRGRISKCRHDAVFRHIDVIRPPTAISGLMLNSWRIQSD